MCLASCTRTTQVGERHSTPPLSLDAKRRPQCVRLCGCVWTTASEQRRSALHGERRVVVVVVAGARCRRRVVTLKVRSRVVEYSSTLEFCDVALYCRHGGALQLSIEVASEQYSMRLGWGWGWGGLLLLVFPRRSSTGCSTQSRAGGQGRARVRGPARVMRGWDALGLADRQAGRPTGRKPDRRQRSGPHPPTLRPAAERAQHGHRSGASWDGWCPGTSKRERHTHSLSFTPLKTTATHIARSQRRPLLPARHHTTPHHRHSPSLKTRAHRPARYV